MKCLTFPDWRRPLSSLNTELYQQTVIPIMGDNYTECSLFAADGGMRTSRERVQNKGSKVFDQKKKGISYIFRIIYNEPRKLLEILQDKTSVKVITASHGDEGLCLCGAFYFLLQQSRCPAWTTATWWWFKRQFILILKRWRQMRIRCRWPSVPRPHHSWIYHITVTETQKKLLFRSLWFFTCWLLLYGTSLRPRHAATVTPRS